MPAKLTLPSIGITNPRFRYRNASSTDISETFRRARRAMRKAAREAATAQQALALEPEAGTVVPLPLPQRAARRTA